jgi:hypothetical protein
MVPKQLTRLFVVGILCLNISSVTAGQTASPGSRLEIAVDTATLSTGEYVDIIATLRNDSDRSFYVGTGVNSRHRGLDFTNFYFTLRPEGTTEWYPRTITFWDRNRAAYPDRSTEQQLIARGFIRRVDPKEAYTARITLRLRSLLQCWSNRINRWGILSETLNRCEAGHSNYSSNTFRGPVHPVR